MSTKLRRFAIGTGSVILLLAVVFSVVGPLIARQSFPQIDGEITLPGLDAPVDVYRDNMGIPHIYASSLHDLFFAQGYVHAQDRFWQMDFWRHIGSARLSEMFGKSQISTDEFLRTLGWRQIAEQEYANVGAEPRAILDAYTEGVNAYLVDHSGTALSLEYGVLKLINSGYAIEPWTPVNSLTWAKAMAWDLRGNMGEEIQRSILLKTLTPAQVDELFPPYPADHPTVVSKIGDFTAATNAPQTDTAQLNASALLSSTATLNDVQRNFAALDSVLGPAGEGIGSNNWVISGSLTATGKPLLANDPHLAIQMPSIWYQVDLHCRPKSDACPYEVAGFSFAGVPGVVIGHNDRIAWGFTNVGPDVMDLYIEKINPNNPNQYEVNGQWVDMMTRTETIKVSGGDPVTITVRTTRHGPIISDTYGALKDKVDPTATPYKDRTGQTLPDPYAISLRWTALEPGSIFDAIWGFDKAANWDDFRQAARSFDVPAQNLVYADVDGNIGYQMPGNIPIRENGDGRLPVPGWTDDYEWTGNIPFEELPYVYNPPQGFVASANNQVPPRDYQYLVTTDWDYGYRAQRITDLITSAPGKIDIAYFQKIQGDDRDLNADTLMPYLERLQTQFGTPNQAKAFDMLKQWDHQDRMDSQPATIFNWFWWDLLAKTFYDEPIPEDYKPTGGARWFEVTRNILPDANSAWWDDKSTTDKVETRDDILAAAFTSAITEMEKKYGSDISKWPAWGDLHTSTFRNQTLGKSGTAPIENIFNRGPFPSAGGESLVNATGWDVGDSFEVNWLPSMRMIVDLSNLNNSVTVHTTGQSGHAYNKHYIDMADLWRNIQYYPMLWDEQATVSSAEGHLVLKP